jgi:hypothetical protein
MARNELNPKILDYLKNKLKGKISETSIQPAISRIRRKDPSLTLNAAAHIYAIKYGLSVQKYFTKPDREVFKTTQIEIKKKVIHRNNKIKIIEIAKYGTNDKLLKANINEINKTYTSKCYTASFILCRKVLENLIIHHILKKKYSGNSLKEREKYYDISRNRYLDFSILLSNLRSSGNDFQPENKLVERICDLAGGFKEEANDMTHSVYHIATKKELDEKNYQQILDLISELEGKIV